MTFSLQSQEILLNKLQTDLKSMGYKCLTARRTGLWNMGEIYLLVRIRAGRELQNKKDIYANINLIPTNKDLKKINNQFFFHKIESRKFDEKSARGEHLLFESGTNATRSVK